MNKRQSDVVLEITAHDPDTVENDLNAAVEIAREQAMKECRHGILVTQQGYASYTVAVSRDVPPTGRLMNGEKSGRTQRQRAVGAVEVRQTGPSQHRLARRGASQFA